MAHSTGGMTDDDMVQWLRDIGDHPANTVAERLEQLFQERRHPVELKDSVKQAVAEGTRRDPLALLKFVGPDNNVLLEAYICQYRISTVGHYRNETEAAEGLFHELQEYVRGMVKY